MVVSDEDCEATEVGICPSRRSPIASGASLYFSGRMHGTPVNLQSALYSLWQAGLNDEPTNAKGTKSAQPGESLSPTNPLSICSPLLAGSIVECLEMNMLLRLPIT